MTLEVTTHRCSEDCGEDPDNRPCLVLVKLNPAMRTECLRRTGVVTPDMHACVNVNCGGVFKALNALAPLQEVVK